MQSYPLKPHLLRLVCLFSCFFSARSQVSFISFMNFSFCTIFDAVSLYGESFIDHIVPSHVDFSLGEHLLLYNSFAS